MPAIKRTCVVLPWVISSAHLFISHLLQTLRIFIMLMLLCCLLLPVEHSNHPTAPGVIHTNIHNSVVLAGILILQFIGPHPLLAATCPQVATDPATCSLALSCKHSSFSFCFRSHGLPSAICLDTCWQAWTSLHSMPLLATENPSIIMSKLHKY